MTSKNKLHNKLLIDFLKLQQHIHYSHNPTVKTYHIFPAMLFSKCLCSFFTVETETRIANISIWVSCRRPTHQWILPPGTTLTINIDNRYEQKGNLTTKEKKMKSINEQTLCNVAQAQ